MVQGGSWAGERTDFSKILLIREALGPSVLLQMDKPVSSIHVLLLATAEGPTVSIQTSSLGWKRANGTHAPIR